MNESWYFFPPAWTEPTDLARDDAPPPGSQPFLEAAARLLPPQISQLHRSFQGWTAARLNPGPVTPGRMRITPEGAVAFRFPLGEGPASQGEVGWGQSLAAWLFLLDKFMETFVVVARARAVWSPEELAQALIFTTPSLLPPDLLRLPPDNWERLARALAQAVADGPLAALPEERHWSRPGVHPSQPATTD